MGSTETKTSNPYEGFRVERPGESAVGGGGCPSGRRRHTKADGIHKLTAELEATISLIQLIAIYETSNIIKKSGSNDGCLLLL